MGIISIAMLEHMIMTGSRILPGVVVGDVGLGSMDKSQVQAELSPSFESALERKITIRGGGKSWSYLPSQLGVTPDVTETVRQAWLIGRKGFFWTRWHERWRAQKYAQQVSLVFQVDEAVLRKTLLPLVAMIEKEPQNAGVRIHDDHTVEILPGVNGVKIDLAASESKLKQVLQSPQQSQCNLVEQVLYPKLTAGDVEKWEITGVVASFDTNFDAAKTERSYNIKTAALALDQVLIMPQEVFSFNDIVGPRTTEAGYKESLVIENNQFTPGIGGGVCQVSTTLYNAVLRADLPIVERHPHSLPITYVPPGMDATVAYNLADLKFVNNRAKPILLHTEYHQGTLKVMIFGTVGEFPQIRVKSKIIEYLEPDQEVIKDPTLAPGQRIIEDNGKKGMIVEVKREIIVDGAVTSSELISRDKYQSQKSVVRVSGEETE